MKTINTLAKHYDQEARERLQNPKDSGIYSQNLKDLNPENSRLGFGCAELFTFLEKEQIQNKRVLDIGCGAGADMIYLNQIFSPKEITGIDISEEMIGLANQRFSQTHLKAIKTSIEEFSDPQKYDLILSNAVIHLNQGKTPIFQKIYDLLEDEGEFLCADFMTQTPVHPKLIQEFQTSGGLFLFGGLESRDVYLNGLASAGFEEVEVLETRCFDPSPQIRNILASKPDLLSSLRQSQFLIVILKARKKAPSQIIPILCPQCKSARTIRHYASINRQIHLNLCKKISGQLWNPCPSCERLEIEAPMQYHDMDAKKMVVALPPEQKHLRAEFEKSLLGPMQKQMPHYHFYLCFGLSEFKKFCQQ